MTTLGERLRRCDEMTRRKGKPHLTLDDGWWFMYLPGRVKKLARNRPAAWAMAERYG